MPIEIKELIIKATVVGQEEQSGRQLPASPADTGGGSREQQLIERCVEQVMDILKIQNER